MSRKNIMKKWASSFVSLTFLALTSCGPPPAASPPPVPVPITGNNTNTVVNPGTSIVTPDPNATLPPTAISIPDSSTPTAPRPATPLAPDSTSTSSDFNISTTTLGTGVVNNSYTATLTTGSGSTPFTWAISSGSLPPGISLDSNTGTISGTPSTEGTYNFTISVSEGGGQSATRSYVLLVTQTSSSLDIATSALSSGALNDSYDQTLFVSGGQGPYAWSITSGRLPQGLSLDSSTGIISGTPSVVETQTFDVKVSDSNGSADTQELSITVNKVASTLAITNAEIPKATLNLVYETNCPCGTICPSTTLQASGNTSQTLTWAIATGTTPTGTSTTSLPTGMTFNTSTGAITGTPTTAGEIGTYSYTFQVTDSDGNSGSRVLSLDLVRSQIFDFTPKSAGHGHAVTLRMDAVDAVLGNNTVKFGNVTATGVSVNNVPACKEIVVEVPVGAPLSLVSHQITPNTDVATSNIPFVPHEVIINEVLTNPDSASNQFVELKNLGTTPTNIAGWSICYTATGTNPATAPLNTTPVLCSQIPSNTPPLGVAQVITLNLNATGSNSANTLYAHGNSNLYNNGALFATENAANEMRFLNGSFTEVVLCSDSGINCSSTAPLPAASIIQDYLQFGAAGGGNEANAVAARIWPVGTSIAINTIATDIDSANLSDGLVNSGAAGLLVTAGSGANFAVNDVVIVDTTTNNGGTTANVNVNRVERTVTASSANNVQINSPVLTAAIQAGNTGDGQGAGNGILVDANTLFNVNDQVIASGSAPLMITGKPTTPNILIELNGRVSANIDNTNNDDGFGVINTDGLLLDAGGSNLFTVGQTVRFDRGTTGALFNIVRTVAAVSTATNRVKLNAAVSSLPISASNTGDGTPGNGVLVTTPNTEWRDAIGNEDPILVNGIARTILSDNPPTSNGLLAGNTLIEYAATAANALTNTTINAANPDAGASSGIHVASTTGFATGDTVKVNSGVNRTISSIQFTNGGTEPRLVLDSDVKSTAQATNTGDGSTLINGILLDDVSAYTAPFITPGAGGALDLSVVFRGQTLLVDDVDIPNNKIMLVAPLASATAAGGSATTIQLAAGEGTKFQNSDHVNLIGTFTPRSLALSGVAGDVLTIPTTSGTIAAGNAGNLTLTVDSTAGMVTNDNITIGTLTFNDVTVASATTLTLGAALQVSVSACAGTCDGTAGNELTIADAEADTVAALIAAGGTVKVDFTGIGANGVSQVLSVNTGTDQLILQAALATPLTAGNAPPQNNRGLIPGGQSFNAIHDGGGVINVIPRSDDFLLAEGTVTKVETTGTINLVPNDDLAVRSTLSVVPTTGTINLVPSCAPAACTVGTVKKKLSFQYDGNGNAITDYSFVTPTAGS